MAISEKIYKPPKWIFWFIAIVLIFDLFGIFMIQEISVTTITLAFMAVLSIAALIELSLSRVAISESFIEISGLFKKEILIISECAKVKVEDHELFIHMKNGKVRRMPYWFTGKNSLQKILSNRIKR